MTREGEAGDTGVVSSRSEKKNGGGYWPSGIKRKLRKVSKFHIFLCLFRGGRRVAGSY